MKKVNFAKLLSLLALVVSVCFFSSCEKDDDGDAGVDAASIIGAWTSTGTVVDITINDVSIIDFFMEELGLSEAEAEEFSSLFEDEMDMEGTVEFKEDGEFATNWEGDAPESGTWALSNENTILTIAIDGEDENMVFDVITLTSSLLTIEQTQTELEDMDQDGTDETMKMKMTMSFSK